MSRIIIFILTLVCLTVCAKAQNKENAEYKIFTTIEEANANPEQVQYLDLSKQKLKEFPSTIFKFKNLECLILKKNKIAEIPSAIEELEKLTLLDVSRNKLNKFPKELCNCQQLKTLILNQNEIDSLPSEISKMSNLTSLDLWGNQIDQLPKEINKLSNTLKVLDLRVIYMSDEKQEAIIKLLPETDIYFSNGCSCH